ncbi:MAG: ribosome biogenesis GTPase Der [Candidatus Erginobacter occultus]|nr:ribosome biogenesis GTPase Der [Candidatus Erginobacter occultus]
MNSSPSASLPLVAVVGRPNVGKSTLFNRLIGRRVAVVHNEAGTTRDRIYGQVHWDNRAFRLVDTGGLIPGGQEGLEEKIALQVAAAVGEADLCLLTADIQEGLNPLDGEVARVLRHRGKTVIVALNKADNPELELGESEFARLGFAPVFPISALHGLGIGELLDAVIACLPRASAPLRPRPPSLAVVGRPNVGKSTLVNRLAGSDRVVVDDRPGTTRDAVDTAIVWRSRELNLIDTAGLQRRSQGQSPLDFFSLHRTRKGIERSDVVLLLMETPEAPTRTDANFIKMALDSGKGCILGINKWDLSGRLTRREYRRTLEYKLPFAGFLPVIFFSGLTGTGLRPLMETVFLVASRRAEKISTGVLNRILSQAQEKVPGRRRKHSSLRIFYAVQTRTAPPVIRLFVNNPELLSDNYRKYLERILRAACGFEGVPIRFELRKRRE